jgi:hypothetical protein
MHRFIRSLCLLSVLMSASTASAVVVTYMGTDYEVTTKTGTFLDLNSSSITDGTRLVDQVWWGSDAEARKFAELSGLGQIYFAARFPAPPILGCYYIASSDSTSCTPLSDVNISTWAVPNESNGYKAENGTFWDMIASYIAAGTPLQDQTWWGSDAKAQEAAKLSGLDQAYFAARFEDVLGCYYLAPPSDQTTCTPLGAASQQTWAVATRVTPVPLPASGLLLLTGLGAAAGLGYKSKRRERARAQV